MIVETDEGGFGRVNERTAKEWCERHAVDQDSSDQLALECAEVFDFYDESGSVPPLLFEIARLAVEEDIGDAFGGCMARILNEERGRRRWFEAPSDESYGRKRADKIQESTVNRIRYGR